jgi:branched-chain amino acid transport system substrate-binding protein
MRTLAFAIWLCASGCSAALNFHECDTSKDCANRMVDGGAALFCNSDHQCIDTTPCVVSVAPDPRTSTGTPLVIAGLYKTSGPNDVNDHAIRNAADLAAAEINSYFPVTHVVCDTGGDKAQAQLALKVAVETFHAVAVVGPDTSGEFAAVEPLVMRYGVAMVSPSATNPGIADFHTPTGGLTWRTCPSDNLQAKVLAMLVPSTAMPLDIVWVSPNDYADGLERAFIMASGRTDAKPIQFTGGDAASLTSAVAQMNAPAYALLIADTDAPDLVKALHGAPGQSMTQYLMTDSALAPTLWGAAPFDFAYLARIRGTAPALPAFSDPSGPVFAAFSTSYQGRFHEDPANTAFVANAYDAFYVLAIAAGAVGARATGAQIAANIARMSDPNGKKIPIDPSDFQAGVNQLKSAGATIDLVGTSGPIDFGDNGDIVTAPIQVWTIAMSAGAPTFKTVMTITP